MLLILPFLVIGLFVAMFLLRTDKTGQCKRRQTARGDGVVTWTCPVCNMTTQTALGEPRFCGAKRASLRPET